VLQHVNCIATRDRVETVFSLFTSIGLLCTALPVGGPREHRGIPSVQYLSASTIYLLINIGQHSFSSSVQKVPFSQVCLTCNA
jgi:hypothetical protein